MRIKEFRTASGLSQIEVAERLNVTQGAVSQWELGLSTPKVELLPKIASLFGCTVDELFKVSGKEE